MVALESGRYQNVMGSRREMKANKMCQYLCRIMVFSPSRMCYCVIYYANTNYDSMTLHLINFGLL